MSMSIPAFSVHPEISVSPLLLYLFAFLRVFGSHVDAQMHTSLHLFLYSLSAFTIYRYCHLCYHLIVLSYV